MIENNMSNIKIGGVTYEQQDIESSDVITKERTNNKGVFEQYKEYVVKLKNGLILRYEEQDEANNATVDMDNKHIQRTSVFGLNKGKIFDKAEEKGGKPLGVFLKLYGCQDCDIDVKQGESTNFWRPLGGKSHSYGKYNQVSIYNRELSNGSIQESHKNHIALDSDDLLFKNNKKVDQRYNTFYYKEK